MDGTSSTAPVTRAELMRVLAPFRTSHNVRGALLTLLDYFLLGVSLWFAATVPDAVVRIIAGLFAGFFITRLWVIGHDACHQALFSTRKLNKFFGRLSFLPSLTPYTMWEVGHNVAHHGYNNLRGGDYVWAPMSEKEYLESPAWRRLLERLYRSGFGVGFYYLIELWWNRLYVPSMPHSKPRRKGFTLDFTLTTVYGIAWVAAVVVLAQQAGVGTLAALISAVLVPFFAWGVLVGLTIHVHHIHPDIPWYTDRKAWKEAQAVYTGTAHIDWPVANFLFHNIFEHQAHHIDARISLFELKAAQAALEKEFPDVFTRRKLSWGDYFAGVKTCKVFDYQEKVWKPFPQT